MSKKTLHIALIFILFITSLGITPTADADLGDIGTGQTGMKFDSKTGEFTYVAVNTMATTSTRYVSTGWVVRLDTTCNGSDPLTSQCSPTLGDKFVRFYLDQDMKKERDDINTPSVGKVTTTYKISAEDFWKKVDASPLKDQIEDGTTLFMSAIFQVREGNGPPLPEQYLTLNAIRSAKPWRDKSGFRQYYDQPIIYQGMAPVEVRLVDKKNKLIDTQAKAVIDHGEYKIGPVSKVYNMKEKYTSSTGKTYTLKGSFQEEKVKKTQYTWENVPEGNPWNKRKNSTRSRSPRVFPQGTILYVVYEVPEDIDCGCVSETTIPNATTLGGEVKTDTIGKTVPINVDMKQSDEDLADWKKALASQTNVRFKLDVTRTGGAGSPNITANEPIGQEKVLSRAKILDYLGGNQKLTIKDDLTSQSIGEGQVLEYKYLAKITITFKDSQGKDVVVECEYGDAANIKFFRKPKKDDNKIGTYTSVPSYWSEIKEGSPYNETFEAMAGTPTTRSLYFATGGSEFIVDVETEYVESATATRTYKSYFSAVPSGFNLPVITGPTTHEVPPVCPPPRTSTDISGATYTETVSLNSTKHVTKPEVKDGEGNVIEAEESHTDYWCVSEGYYKMVGGYSDTWTQTSTFDYTKLNKAHVWKIERSKVTGMASLVGTNEVEASIVQGDPTIFANIASSNTSAAGRLRYSLETNQHDNVVWYEGPSDNRDANSDSDSYVNEQQKFKERRALTTNVTAVSDFLILQTSSGDQSVMYFDKQSNTAKVTDPLIVPKTSKAAQWDSNSNSAARWNENAINIGSYNGNYGSPFTKYNGSGSRGTVSTIFDSMPAGLNRPARPSGDLRLMKTGINPIREAPNGLYVTGTSTVVYKQLLNKGTASYVYPAGDHTYVTPYSPSHSKVNDVVIHDPVSVEKAIVLPLPSERDQRTQDTKFLGGNLQDEIVEYEKVLKKDYRQNLIPNGNAEIQNSDGTVAGWKTWYNKEKAEFDWSATDNWKINGNGSFEIRSQPNQGINGVYYIDVPVKAGKQYKFSGLLAAHRTKANFYIDLKKGGTIVETHGTPEVANVATPQKLEINFTVPSGADTARIHIVKGGSHQSTNLPDYAFADDLVLNNMSDNEWIGLGTIYQEISSKTAGTPDVKHEAKVSNSNQLITIQEDGNYDISAWSSRGTSGAKGGFFGGTITLKKGDVLEAMVNPTTIYNPFTQVMLKGTQQSRLSYGFTNYNLAGFMTYGVVTSMEGLINKTGIDNGIYNNDVTRYAPNSKDVVEIVVKNTSKNTSGEIFFATPGSYHQAGNAISFVMSAEDSEFVTYRVPIGTKKAYTDMYAIGMLRFDLANGNDVNKDVIIKNIRILGEGTGELLFTASANAGGVTSSKVTNAVKKSGNESMTLPDGGVAVGNGGEGLLRLVKKGIPGATTTERVPIDLGGTEPPDEAYDIIPKKSDPMQEVDVPGLGKYSPGNFLNLDYAFQVYYPNIGDFYGNGAHGISETTAIPGKGFINGMDTTEWTESKAIRFEFPVIYKGQMYLANNWISLPVSESMFDFYVPLAAKEKMSALVQFESIAINGEADGDAPINKVRYENLAARHNAIKRFNIDLVGNIGNLVIEDTGDFRFSNLFKKALVPTKWLVPNLVKQVDIAQQNKIVGDLWNIRGDKATAEFKYLNTYGLQKHKEQAPISLPLSPEKNNISALQKQPMRLGYNVLADVETTGNYYAQMQIIPYYYHLNLLNGKYTPIDVYMNVNGNYKPINKHGIVREGWNPNSVYAHKYVLKWEEEAARRNYSAGESKNTDAAAEFIAMREGITQTGGSSKPVGGNYVFGNAQILSPTGKNRTYVGTSKTYGNDKNPGKLLPEEMYGMQAQRWHFTYGLPSSAVIVPKGEPISKKNMEKLMDNNSVIVMAGDIKAIGDTYALEYRVPGGNNPIRLGNKTFQTTEIEYPVLTVISTNKSSKDDLRVGGTH